MRIERDFLIVFSYQTAFGQTEEEEEATAEAHPVNAAGIIAFIVIHGMCP